MSLSEDAAKSRWLANLNRPFGSILDEQNETSGDRTETIEQPSSPPPENASEAAKPWPVKIEPRSVIRPENASDVMEAWLAMIERLPPPSATEPGASPGPAEEAAARAWLDQQKRSFQSLANASFD